MIVILAIIGGVLVAAVTLFGGACLKAASDADDRIAEGLDPMQLDLFTPQDHDLFVQARELYHIDYVYDGLSLWESEQYDAILYADSKATSECLQRQADRIQAARELLNEFRDVKALS